MASVSKKCKTTTRPPVAMGTYPMSLLKENGVGVMSLDLNDMRQVEADFEHMLRTMPEFIDPESMFQQGKPFVLGSFGGLGTPTSFFHPSLMKLRAIASAKVEPVLKDLYEDTYPTVRQHIDRACYRPRGTKIAAESVHRDICEHTDNTTGLNLGGFINLNATETQYFSCVVGSHLDIDMKSGTTSGFHKEKLGPNQFMSTIAVPPGHIIVFYTMLLHEIKGMTYKYNMYRLFIGWNLSASVATAAETIVSFCNDQIVQPLPSGQEPPMYAKLHWANWIDKLTEFAQLLKPEHRVVRDRKQERFEPSPTNPDETIKVVTYIPVTVPIQTFCRQANTHPCESVEMYNYLFQHHAYATL